MVRFCECMLAGTQSGRTSSRAFLKASSMSSSGVHTRGTPLSSYRKRSSKLLRSLAKNDASDVCSLTLARNASQARWRSVRRALSFSSFVQSKAYKGSVRKAKTMWPDSETYSWPLRGMMLLPSPVFP